MSKRMTSEELVAHKKTHTMENSWWLNDKKGIPCSRVCEVCESDVKATYNKWVFDDGPYEAEEQVEPD